MYYNGNNYYQNNNTNRAKDVRKINCNEKNTSQENKEFDNLSTSNEVSKERCSNNTTYTTSWGKAIDGDANSLTVGTNGPVLLQDLHLLDKLSRFDRERIPERVVHANGTGAFGVFKCYRSMEKYTMASFLNTQGKETPVLARFSTVIGSKGSADTARDPRGFAVKFYTEDGNYDLVGNNIPVFFIRDAIKFPDLIHSLKPTPDTNIQSDERFWDFISFTPEATHMLIWLYSDNGTIKSYRHTNGFSVNTYSWINREGKVCYVKYHWKTMQGLKTIDRVEAEFLAGANPNVAKEDLLNAINRGEYPRYELNVQLMERDMADKLSYNPLDATKVWDEKDFPLIPIGMMTLNKNPYDFYLQIEQAAFSPAHIVNGIGVSEDKLLQGRLFSYNDTHMHRLGTNFMQLQSNRPYMKVNNHQADGQAEYYKTTNEINYSPNALNNNQPYVCLENSEPVINVEGTIKRATIDKTDDFTQAGEKYRSFNQNERKNFIENISLSLIKAKPQAQKRVIEFLKNADNSMGTAVENAIKNMDRY